MNDLISIIITTILTTILTSLILVPIAFFINSKLEFDHFLKLLWEEIEENQKRVNAYLSDFDEIRSGKRNWMPKGQPYQITSDCALVENFDLAREIADIENNNSETDGIKRRYLPDNIYSNFINQKYFLFIQEGYRNSLARLYYRYKCISYLIQKKENDLLKQYGTNERRNHYTKDDFSPIYERYLPLINTEYNDLVKSKESFKKSFWWLPIVDLKKSDKKMTTDRKISMYVFILTLGLFALAPIQIYFSYLQIIAILNEKFVSIALANQILTMSFLFAFGIVILLIIAMIEKK